MSEVTVGDTAAYLGNSMPKYEVAMTNGIDFFHRLFRVGSDARLQGRLQDLQQHRAHPLREPQQLLRSDQSGVIVVRAGTHGCGARASPSRTVAGFIEPGDFIRFRELNVTFTAPDRMGAQGSPRPSLAVTLAARNLGILWTKYSGVDPEAFATTGDAPSEFQAFAPPTYYMLRFSTRLLG